MKVMPATLLCWPVKSEANAGDVAVDIEPSCKYCYVLLPHDSLASLPDTSNSAQNRSYAANISFSVGV